MNSPKSNFTGNIKRLRGEKGLTQKQLAAKIGVAYQYVSRWERGVEPSAKYLAKLASALDVDVSEFTAPPPVSDRREIIGVQTTTDIDTAEARQRRLLEETVVAALVKDPRLRLMDVHLEEIVQCMRSLTEEIGEVKKSIAHLNNLFEKSAKAQKNEKNKVENF